ncbi:MAG: MOSC domain-containing protein [Candidatus Aminicenantales bacterium]
MALSAGEKSLQGQIISVNLSPKKGLKKVPCPAGTVIDNHGLAGDGHAGETHRQISLLAWESIEKMQRSGLRVGPGDFAENITTFGLELHRLPLGTILEIGNEVVLEITQIGKVCHSPCAIFRQVGRCVMPEEGIFTRVLKGGKIKKGDKIHVRFGK